MGIETAVSEVGDEKVRYYATGSISNPWLTCASDYSDYTHPTVQGNKKFAAKLLEVLTEDIRNFFPSKCGGSGKYCAGAASPTPVATPTVSPTRLAPIANPTLLPTAASPPPSTGTAVAKCCWVDCNTVCHTSGWCVSSKDRCTGCAGIWCEASPTSSPPPLTSSPTMAPSTAAPTTRQPCAAALPIRQGASDSRCAATCGLLPLGRWPCGAGGPCDCGSSS